MISTHFFYFWLSIFQCNTTADVSIIDLSHCATHFPGSLHLPSQARPVINDFTDWCYVLVWPIISSCPPLTTLLDNTARSDRRWLNYVFYLKFTLMISKKRAKALWIQLLIQRTQFQHNNSTRAKKFLS